MRRFLLERVTDSTGVSGTGWVAEGVQFTNGLCALTWRVVNRKAVPIGRWSSVATYSSLEALQHALYREIDSLPVLDAGDGEAEKAATALSNKAAMYDLQYENRASFDRHSEDTRRWSAAVRHALRAAQAQADAPKEETT